MAAVTPAELTALVVAGERAAALPLTLAIETGNDLELCELLRLLPGKRAVFRARWRGRPALAKWYAPGGRRQFERECRGAALLREGGLPTAALLYRRTGQHGSLLVFDWLEGESLAAFWQRECRGEERAGLTVAHLGAVLVQLRSAGLRQTDLHFDNFMVSPGIEGCAVIDVASVERAGGGRAGHRQFRRDLGLLAAQVERLRQQAFCLQLEQQLQEPALLALCERAWRWRRRQFLRKCFRDSTAVEVQRSRRRFCAMVRAASGPELRALLTDPDAMTAAAEVLKDGGSSTVFRLLVDGRPLVVKRYNLKSFGHRLRRAVQPTRATHSWRNSHHLQLIGFPTAAPVAMLEERRGPLRGRGWFIAEAVAAEPLLPVWHRREPTTAEARNVRRWFRLAALEQLIHGDLKATNWLVDGCGEIWLIDLDAMHQVRSRRLWKRRDQAERRRFLANWNNPGYQSIIDTAVALAPDGDNP